MGLGGDLAQDRLAQLPAEESAEFNLEYHRETFRWAAAQVRDLVSETHWNVFSETTLAGRPIAEVAAENNMSVGSVYIVRSRVMARLKKMVQRFEEQDS